ncbi:MAG: hypothetical protein IPH57_12775 [Saprospiraceae bacterium]|nr:hypothetical protein [Saprospiraceae bacterium]
MILLENYYIGDNISLPETIEYESGLKIVRLTYSIFILDKIKRFRNISMILSEEKPNMIYFHDFSFNLHEAVKYKKKMQGAF